MSYNGHKSWAQWNVSLWINHDQDLYSMAFNCVRCYPKARESAARHMLQRLKDDNITQTPDGAKYTITSIRNAMKGL